MATIDNQNPTSDSTLDRTPAAEPNRKISVYTWADKYAFPVIVILTAAAIVAIVQLFNQVTQMKEQISNLKNDQISSQALENHLNDSRQAQSEIKTSIEALRQRVENLRVNESVMGNELKDMNNHVDKVENTLAAIGEIKERLAILEATLKLKLIEEKRSPTPAVQSNP